MPHVRHSFSACAADMHDVIDLLQVSVQIAVSGRQGAQVYRTAPKTVQEEQAS